MPHDFNTNTDDKDEWLTPPFITEAVGPFDLDPCQPIDPPFVHAATGFNILDDGLERDWFGRVWCNPPYGRETFLWLEKLAHHGNGTALIFARTETKGFHSQIWEKADALFFFRGRIKFFNVHGVEGGAANAPSCLVAYGDNNVKAIKKAVDANLLGGRIVALGERYEDS